MRIPYLYSLLLCLIHLSTSRFYNVNLTDLKNVKLQPHQQIIFSPFAGIFIDRLSLEQVTGNQFLYTTLCQVVPATIKSQVKAVAVFQNTEQSPKILSTFQELKNFKTAIDLILWKGKYYVMFKAGVVEMYGVEEESQELVKLGDVKWGREVASGYFVSSKNVLLYASSRQLIWVEENGTLIEIKGYGPHDTFIYPYLVNQTVLLIAEESQTITKYVINTGFKTLISKVGIQLPSSLSLDVEDLAYDQYRSIAMILDYTKGVYFLNLHPNNTFSINPKYSINVSSCQNMVFRNDFLYITCPNFYRYSMKNLELLQQQVPLYPQDLVITEDNQIILKGSSHMIYQRRWQSRPIVFELIEPIRMVFDNKRIVYISNHQLVQESIVIQNDVVKCVPDDSHHPGDYVIHASSTGPCANSLASAVPTTCSYTRNIDVEVWVAHQIYWVIMGIACIILAIGVLISMGWCFVKRTILKRKQREYQILVDENEGYLSAKPEVQLQEQSTNQMNTNKKQEIVTLEE